jgi:hypothetical protein
MPPYRSNGSSLTFTIVIDHFIRSWILNGLRNSMFLFYFFVIYWNKIYIFSRKKFSNVDKNQEHYYMYKELGSNYVPCVLRV